MSYTLYIPGQCVPKQRPQFSRKTGKAYTPQKTLDYEGLVATVARKKIRKPLTGGIKLTIYIFEETPKSWTKKKKQEALDGKVFSIRDLDNMVKSICDGMNKVAYNDDKQVVSLMAEKKYSDKSEVVVIVEEISKVTE